MKELRTLSLPPKKGDLGSGIPHGPSNKNPLADMSDMHRVAARGGGCGCIGYLESPKSVEEKVPGIAAATHNQIVRE